MKRTRSAEGSLEKGQGGCRGAPSISVDRISFKRKRSLEKLEEERREPRPKSPRPAPNITRSYKMPITRLPVLEFPRSGASGTDPESNLRNKIEGCDKTQRQGDLANVKPDIPFFKLIRMAIESSPDKRMLLSEIYTYILGYFPYFKTAGEGWKVPKCQG